MKEYKKRCLSLLDRYFHGKGSDDLQSLVPPVQTFTARTRQTPSTELNHPHFLRISNVRRKFHSDNFFFQALLIYGTNPRLDISLNSELLTSSSE